MKKLKSFIALGIAAALIVSGTRGSVAMATETEGIADVFTVDTVNEELPEITEDNQEISGGNSEANDDQEVTYTDEGSIEEIYSEDYEEETQEAVSDGNAEVSDGNAEEPTDDVFVIMPEEINGGFEGDVWNHGTSALTIGGDWNHIYIDDKGQFTVDDGFEWYIHEEEEKLDLSGMEVYAVNNDSSERPIKTNLRDGKKRIYVERNNIQKGENLLKVKKDRVVISDLTVIFRADLQAPSVTDWGFEKTPLESTNGYYSESPLTLQIFSEDKQKDENDALEIASGVNKVKVRLTKNDTEINKEIDVVRQLIEEKLAQYLIINV